MWATMLAVEHELERASWIPTSIAAVAAGAGLSAVVMVVILGVVLRFLLRSNVFTKKNVGEPARLVTSRSSSDIHGLMGKVDLPTLQHNHSDVDLLHLADMDGSESATPSRRRRLREAVGKLSLKSAVERFRERRRFRWVTAETKQGDGLKSIFSDDRTTKKLPSFDLKIAGREKMSAKIDKKFDREGHADILKSLRRTEIFSWVPDQILRSMASRVQKLNVPIGTTLYSTGTEIATPCYFIVLQGRVSICFQAKTPASGVISTPEHAREDQSTTLSEETVSKVGFGRDQSITGLSELLAAITGEATHSVASAVAEEDSVVIKISNQGCLESVFGEYPGFREELLLRILIRLNRVTLMSAFRLSGRVIMPDKHSQDLEIEEGDVSKSHERQVSIGVQKELGLSEEEYDQHILVVPWNESTPSSSTTYEDANAPGGAPLMNLLGGDGDIDSEDSNDEGAVKVPVHIVRMSSGQSIVNISNEPAMYIVLEGRLDLFVGQNENDTSTRLERTYRPGEAFGHLSLLTGAWNDWYVRRHARMNNQDSIWVRASSSCKETVLARISQTNYNKLLDAFPKIVLHKARDLVCNLSPLIRMIDLATQWQYVGAGDVVLREGETSDWLYVVLHGRLRGIVERPDEKDSPGREYGRGCVVGETSFLTEQAMDQTVVAMRSGQLAAIPKAAMVEMMRVDPRVVFHIGRIMSRGILSEKAGCVSRSIHMAPDLRSSVVAIVPASPNAPIENFLYTLSAAMRFMGSTVDILNSDIVERMAEERKLGMANLFSGSLSALEQMILLNWLAEAEDTHDVVFYQADPWVDPEPSWWSKFCVEQADMVLFVGNARDSPSVTTLESKLAAVNTNARKELVLVHTMTEDTLSDYLPKNTRDWIVNRGNIYQHHHIRIHPDRTNSYSSLGLYDVEHYRSDFRRLGRWLLGESIGIVLGGGGARGMSHIAVLRAMEDSGMPIDFVGGTSIGAFVGAMYAMKCDTLLMHKEVHQFAGDMSSGWQKLLDLTLPVTAYFSGTAFNRGIVRAFKNTKIEDLWLPFFCMSTDLTDSVEIAHRNGSLWRYVRASMTLVNLIPPLCDVIEEPVERGHGDLPNEVPGTKKTVHYLADGGYTNNLPADLMRQFLGSKATIIAVDVQGSWKFADYDYGVSLSGWRYLFQWLNPFVETPNIPTGADIQTQLAYISSVKQGSTQSLSSNPGSGYSKYFGGFKPSPNRDLRKFVDLFFVPPVDDITTLDFHKTPEIHARSYPYAKEIIASWIEELKNSDSSKLRILSWGTAPSVSSPMKKKVPSNMQVLHRRIRSWGKVGGMH